MTKHHFKITKRPNKQISADDRARGRGHARAFGELLLQIGRQPETTENTHCVPYRITPIQVSSQSPPSTSSSPSSPPSPSSSACWISSTLQRPPSRQPVVLHLWTEIPSHHCLPLWPRPRTGRSSSSRRTLSRRRRSQPGSSRRTWSRRRRRWRRPQVDLGSPAFDQTHLTKTQRPLPGILLVSIPVLTGV